MRLVLWGNKWQRKAGVLEKVPHILVRIQNWTTDANRECLNHCTIVVDREDRPLGF